MLVDHEDYVASSAYGLHFVPTIFLIQPSGEIQISSEGFCKVDFLAIHSELSKVASANGGPELFPSNESIPEYKPG